MVAYIKDYIENAPLANVLVCEEWASRRNNVSFYFFGLTFCKSISKLESYLQKIT